MAVILKGKPVADSIDAKTKAVASILRERGTVPALATLRVGDADGDIFYENALRKRCSALGIVCRSYVYDAAIETDLLLADLDALNSDRGVHGILLFRPLPKQIDDGAVRAALAIEKDVDGITDGSLAGVFTGSGSGFPPCTAQACMELLHFNGVELVGKRAVVIGRSLVVGKPVAMMLMSEHATVTICHTRTADLPGEAKRAEILIAAAGKAGMVDRSFLSAGQVILDVGANADENGKMTGDVVFEDALLAAGAVTPVPGGIGSVTTAVLLRHVAEAAERAEETNRTAEKYR